MRDIAALVFGGELTEGSEARGTDDEHALLCGARYPEPENWCQTQPGHASLAWLGATLSARRSRSRDARGGRP